MNNLHKIMSNYYQKLSNAYSDADSKPRKFVYRIQEGDILTLIHRLPVQMTCWIFPGTSIDLNFAGRSGALCGMCKSPKASTSTIPPIQMITNSALNKQGIDIITLFERYETHYDTKGKAHTISSNN